jgi:hypothetical protein
MARGAYTETAAVRVLRAIVEFAEGEDGHLIRLVRAGRAFVAAPAITVLRTLSVKKRRVLQPHLRTFLRRLAADEPRDAHAVERLRVEIVPGS